MTHNLMRTLHRRIFIFMGIFILAWLLSGIAMLLPTAWFGAASQNTYQAADYRTVTLSPAEAITRLEQHTGKSLNITEVRLTPMLDQWLYSIRTVKNGTGLINSSTGKVFEFSVGLAERLARENYGIGSALIEATHLTAHDSQYPGGPLPAYRLRFDEQPSTVYYVNGQNAWVDRSTALSRLQAGIVGLHEFEPLRKLTDNDKVTHLLLLGTAALSLVGAVFGVVLVFPPQRKNR